MPDVVITPDMLTVITAAEVTNRNQVYFLVENQQGTSSKTQRMSQNTLEALIPDAGGGTSLDGIHWVDTVADLATLAPADGDMVHTLGYLAVGDGGHRSVCYSLSSTATVDGVLVFAGPGGVGRYLACDVRAFITPKMGGCVGNGLSVSPTDDWARMVAVVATGLTVDVSGYNWLLSDKITLATANQKIIGHGTGSMVQGTENKQVFDVTANNVTIEGVRFIGKGTSPSPDTNTLNIAIRAVNIWGLKVRKCYMENFAFQGVYLQGCKVVSVSFNDMWGNITSSHDSSADITCWGNSKTILILGNKCRSDLDVGINVGALQHDRDIIIMANQVIVTDVNGAEINPTQRRRCIGLHYSTDADELNYIICTDNTCAGSVNAGIYFNGWGGAVIITNNTVRNVSIGSVDESLSGGIAVLGSCRSIIIANNDLSTCSSDSVGCINIYRDSSLATPNLGSLVIECNIIHDSSSYGISILGSTARILIKGNNITNCTRHLVFIASFTVLDAEMLVIEGNLFQWSSATVCAVWMDTQGGTNMVNVNANRMVFTGTKGTLAANAGIYSQRMNLKAHHNHIKGCKTGVYFYTGLTGRSLDADVDYNHFEDVDVACVGRGTTANTCMFIGQNNRFDNVAAVGDGDTYYNAVWIGHIDRVNAQVIMRLSATPAAGTWVTGDTVYFTSPAASGNIGTVYTSSGWKTFGAIAA